MAHSLNFAADGTARMMFAGEAPWHGLGKRLEANCTASEALAAAQLGYQMGLSKVFTADMSPVPGFRAVTRLDTREALGVVTDSYTLLQNTDLAGFCEAVVGAGQAVYHTAGALGKGEDVWFLLELGAVGIGPAQDQVDRYLLATNNHTGKRAMRALWTPVRVVCQNTLNGALRGAGKDSGIRIRHVGNVQGRVQEAQRVLGLADRAFSGWKERMEVLSLQTASKDQVRAFVEALFPNPNETELDKLNDLPAYITKARDSVVQKFDGAGIGLDVPGVRGTNYALYNAAVEWFDHDRKSETAETRMAGLMWGVGPTFKSRALELLAK